MVWGGRDKSVIDLCILPCDLSADLAVVDVRAGVHVHRALAVFVHSASVGAPNIIENTSDIVGHRPRTWKLTPGQLSSFRATDWSSFLGTIQQ